MTKQCPFFCIRARESERERERVREREREGERGLERGSPGLYKYNPLVYSFVSALFWTHCSMASGIIAPSAIVVHCKHPFSTTTTTSLDTYYPTVLTYQTTLHSLTLATTIRSTWMVEETRDFRVTCQQPFYRPLHAHYWKRASGRYGKSKKNLVKLVNTVEMIRTTD